MTDSVAPDFLSWDKAKLLRIKREVPGRLMALFDDAVLLGRVANSVNTVTANKGLKSEALAAQHAAAFAMHDVARIQSVVRATGQTGVMPPSFAAFIGAPHASGVDVVVKRARATAPFGHDTIYPLLPLPSKGDQEQSLAEIMPFSASSFGKLLQELSSRTASARAELTRTESLRSDRLSFFDPFSSAFLEQLLIVGNLGPAATKALQDRIKLKKNAPVATRVERRRMKLAPTPQELMLDVLDEWQMQVKRPVAVACAQFGDCLQRDPRWGQFKGAKGVLGYAALMAGAEAGTLDTTANEGTLQMRTFELATALNAQLLKAQLPPLS